MRTAKTGVNRTCHQRTHEGWRTGAECHVFHSSTNPLRASPTLSLFSSSPLPRKPQWRFPRLRHIHSLSSRDILSKPGPQRIFLRMSWANLRRGTTRALRGVNQGAVRQATGKGSGFNLLKRKRGKRGLREVKETGLAEKPFLLFIGEGGCGKLRDYGICAINLFCFRGSAPSSLQGILACAGWGPFPGTHVFFFFGNGTPMFVGGEDCFGGFADVPGERRIAVKI